MQLSYDQARSLILRWLRELSNGSSKPPWTANARSLLAKRTDGGPTSNTNDERLISEIFHALYLERVIATGNQSHVDPNRLSWPHFWITEHGQKVLQQSKWCPYDPDGYLKNLGSDIPKLDPVILAYVAEAMECYRRDCLLASSVMLGGASERAVLLLIDSYTDSIVDPAKKQHVLSSTEKLFIKKKHDVFMKEIDPVKNQFPSDLRSGLDRNLVGIFGLIRETRNDAGHPTDARLDRNAVHGNLLLFPGYCRYVYELMEYFQHNPNNA